jgi:8-oxo-dGTP pyrophosphatase MutT (NUDIX family)
MKNRFQKEIDQIKKIGFLNPYNLSEELVHHLPNNYSVRAIIITPANKVVIIYRSSFKIHNIVGGHVEDNESLQGALIRECKEESGYDISEIKLIGYIELWRKKYKSFSFCFLVRGIGFPSKINITKEEEEEGHEIFEYDYTEALEIFKKELKETNSASVERALLFLLEAQKYL